MDSTVGKIQQINTQGATQSQPPRNNDIINTYFSANKKILDTSKKTFILPVSATVIMIVAASIGIFFLDKLPKDADTITDAEPTEVKDVPSLSSRSKGQVKGALTINIPTQYQDGISVKGTATFDDGIVVPNVIYSINLGGGLSSTGGQNPTLANTGVLSFAGQTGDISLAAGNGLAVDGLTIENTDTGSGQNIFKTITAGDDSFSAGSNSDTLKFLAGTGITFSTNTSDKSITISGSKGASYLASNGLTLTDSSFGLGGALTDKTTLDLNNHDLLFSGSGNIGIGTTTPTAKLSLLGNQYIEGSSTISNNLEVNGSTILAPTTAGADTLTLRASTTTPNKILNITNAEGDASYLSIASDGSLTVGGSTLTNAGILEAGGAIKLTNASDAIIGTAIEGGWTLEGKTFNYRRTISIKNNSSTQSLPINEDITLELSDNSASELCSHSRSDGNDIRVSFGSSEIARNITYSCNTNATITFRLQEAIAPSSTNTSYHIYYGNSTLSASAPTYTVQSSEVTIDSLDDISTWTSTNATNLAISQDTTTVQEGTGSMKIDASSITQGIGTVSTSGQSQLSATSSLSDVVVHTAGNGTTYIYKIGGDASPEYNYVYRATIDSSTGDIGAFSSHKLLPLTKRSGGSYIKTINGTTYLYVIGGANPTDAYRATIDTNGNVGSFSNTNQGPLPGTYNSNTGPTYSFIDINGTTYIYATGGIPTTSSTAVTEYVYKSYIDEDGNIAPFTYTSTAPWGAGGEQSFALTINGTTYYYLLGGWQYGSTSVARAVIDNNGDIGSFTFTNQAQLPRSMAYHRVITYQSSEGNWAYIIGGVSFTTYLDTIYRSRIDENGNIGTWSTTGQGPLPSALRDAGVTTAIINGTSYVYTVGGSSSSNINTTTVAKGILTEPVYKISRTIPSLDLSDKGGIRLKIYSSIVGSKLKFEFSNDNGTTWASRYITVNTANTWETKMLDISDIANGEKDSVTRIRIGAIDSLTAFTAYIDDITATRSPFSDAIPTVSGGTAVLGSNDLTLNAQGIGMIKLNYDSVNSLGGSAGLTLYNGGTTELFSVNNSGNASLSGALNLSGPLSFFSTNAPTTKLTVAVNSDSGALDGTFYYAVTFVTSNGETEVSPTSSAVAPNGQQVDITDIPIGPNTVTARKIYRKSSAAGYFYLLTTLADNTTTAYRDNIPQNQLSEALINRNTTAGTLYLDNTVLFNATPSLNNLSIGTQALPINVSGTYNTALGFDSLYSNTSGSQNTAIGYQTLYSNTSTGNNIALGYKSLYKLSSGSGNNIAIGNNAMYNNPSGSSNVFIGSSAGYNGYGNSNTVVGYQAGYGTSSITNNNNSIFGYQAGYRLTTGSNNLFFGYKAGYTATSSNAVTSGSNNTYIGYQAGPGTSTQLTNAGAIGYNALVSQSNSLVLGGTGANAVSVGIGTETPIGTLNIEGNPIGKALVNLNYTGTDQNIFTASSSGSTKFVIANNGNIGINNANPAYKLDVAGTTNITGDTTLGSTLTLSQFTNCTLKTDATGNIICGNDNTGDGVGTGESNSTWSMANGTLFPTNISTDLLLGSSATSSAKFGAINMNTNTPVLFTSGNLGIGTSTPTSKLHIITDKDSDTNVRLQAGTADDVVGTNSGPNNPTSYAQLASSGTNTWSTSSNILASDNAYATATVSTAGQKTYYLKATGYNFSIPTNATITGMKVEVEAKASNDSTTRFDEVEIIKNGTIISSPGPSAPGITTADTVYSFGHPDYLWGETWTPADINSSNFGFVMTAINYMFTSTVISIDHIKITVYYTLPGTGSWIQGIDVSEGNSYKIGNAADLGTNDYFTIRTSGNVGIGTTSPDSRMQVTGGGLCVGSDANCNSDNNTEGVIYAAATNTTVYDVAENYPTKDADLEAGDVVVLDKSSSVFVKKSTGSDDEQALGVVSAKPGLLLGGFNGQQFKEERQVAVGLSGRIPVKVTTENGSIKIGDPLALSSTPGAVAKATQTGWIVGRALENYDETNVQNVGQIMMYINSIWYSPAAESLATSLLASDSAEFTTVDNLPTDFADIDVLKVNSDLTVFGTTTLREVSIQDTIGIGSEMEITSNSINTLTQDFEIQPLKQAAIDFMAGAVRIEKDGTVSFAENVTFAKNIEVKGTATVNTIAIPKTKITTLSNTEVEASGSAGTLFIKAGQTIRKVVNPHVSENSLIYITAVSDTQGQAPYIVEQVTNDATQSAYFTVKINQRVNHDIKFNFLIINQK